MSSFPTAADESSASTGGSKDTTPVICPESSSESENWLHKIFHTHAGWDKVNAEIKAASKLHECITGDVLTGDTHAPNASNVTVVFIHSYPVKGIKRMMELNLTGDGLDNYSVGKVFDDIVTMLKDSYDMSHDEAVACVKNSIAMMDSIPAVADWDWRSHKSKKISFHSLIEAGLRQRMSIIIIDALKKLPSLKTIVGLGEEAAAMLALIAQNEDLSKLITQKEKLPHGMRLRHGFANDEEVKRYLGAIDMTCAVLTGQSPRGLNDLNMGKYVAIAIRRYQHSF
jgi:hypothetical protein